MTEQDLTPTDLRGAVERELGALGDPSRGMTRDRLAGVVLGECDAIQRIARYLWAALALSGDILDRETVLSEVERAAEDARRGAAAVGEGPTRPFGAPDDVLRLATDATIETAADDSAVEGMKPAAGGLFFAQAVVLVEEFVRPETDLAAGLDADELRLTVARLCARLAHDADDPDQQPDEEVWAQIEQQVADRLARIDPGPDTQHQLATALLYRLTQVACNDELTDSMFRDGMVEAAAIATTALALAPDGDANR